VSRIDSSAFFGCQNLIDVAINSTNLQTLNEGLFRECKALKTILIPNCVTAIKDRVFQECANLEAISLPSALQSCGDFCFYGCTNLRLITSNAVIAPTVNSSTFGASSSGYAGRNSYNTGENMLYVPAGATGYDTGLWLDPLCNSDKCGFTLSATL
jgi:hypothetical protein